MPSYPHIEEYRAKLQELIEFGGSDNEENIRPAFQNCLDAYCHDHRERLVLIPELKTSPGNKPDGTVKDSLRMARGYWEAKDSHDDLDAEIKVKFNRGYPRDNIIFEDSQTAVLVQNGNEAVRVDMSRDGELHRLIRIFLDYELPEIQEFRHAQSQFKTDLPTVLENLRATVAEAEADNPEYQEAASSFLDLCRRTIGPAVSPADVGPVQVAALAGRLSAETVRALAEESSGPVGRLLGIPVDGADATVEGLKADIKNAAGRVALLETGDWGNAGGDAKVDLKVERFGAEPPASLVDLVDVSSREIYAACGFNAALWGGSQAASVREAWRLALFGVLSPLGRLVEAELQEKLEDTVTLSWQELRASDLSGRARAFQSMVGGGMAVDQAVAVAGLMVED